VKFQAVADLPDAFDSVVIIVTAAPAGTLFFMKNCVRPGQHVGWLLNNSCFNFPRNYLLIIADQQRLNDY
jgi:hypothetical protein